MALKAVLTCEALCLDHVPGSPSAKAALLPGSPPEALRLPKNPAPGARFFVVGHRGNGMNVLASTDPRMRAVKENSLLSFNRAACFPLDFIEFDVQVTKDDHPIIFHDDTILTGDSGEILERHITDLSLEEFLSYGPQRDPKKMGKLLLRKINDGRVVSWNVDEDDSLCTLQEAFEKVDSRLGFNIELKFLDHSVYAEEELMRALQAVLQVVYKYANDRPIFFSTFQPDAAQLMRKLQSAYPVFFLTNAGTEIFDDVRRNSLEEALKLCVAGGLQGIVSDVKGVFSNPSLVPRIKESNLSLLTYGRLNNVPEAVYMLHLMGINGVIVDLVHEITEAVSDLIEVADDSAEQSPAKGSAKPTFSERELSFLLKLIPQLLQQQRQRQQP